MTNRIAYGFLSLHSRIPALRRNALVALSLLIVAATPAFTGVPFNGALNPALAAQQAPIPYRCPLRFHDLQRKTIDSQLLRVRSGDLDNDGMTDIVVLGYREPTLYRGLRGGGYGDAEFPMAGLGTEDFALIDVNDDGFLDVVRTGGNRLETDLGDGRGGLTETFALQSAGLDRATAIVVGRFGGPSANLDAVIIDVDGEVRTFEGSGDGTFAAGVTQSFDLDLVTYTRSIIADLDGDGFDDIALIEYPSKGISILHNRGDRSFELQIVDAPDSTGVTAGDVDGDGLVDLVFVIQGRSLSLVRNLGNMQFDAPVRIESIRTPPTRVLLADLDGDGILDLLTNDIAGGTVVIGLGQGDGTFSVLVTSDPASISELTTGTSGTRRTITTVGYTSGEMATWSVTCTRLRAVRPPG